MQAIDVLEQNNKDLRMSLEVCEAIGTAIRSLGSVPSGHLYAHLCGKLSMGSYNNIIAILKNSKLVEERSSILIWVGPK